jgi:hypothetical protein
MTTDTLMTDAATPEGAGSQTAATEAAAQATTTDAATQQQAAEGQTTETATAEEGVKTEGDAEQPQGAPEQYESFTAPDGAEFDGKVIEQFSEVAKELNLPQDAAQKLLDKMGPTIATRQSEQLEAARQQWAADAKADKEFGGDKLNENLAFGKKALDTFGTPELRTLLNDSGLGNHPEVIRMMVRAGKAISEDRVVTGGGAITTDQSTAQRMYPNMNP